MEGHDLPSLMFFQCSFVAGYGMQDFFFSSEWGCGYLRAEKINIVIQGNST